MDSTEEAMGSTAIIKRKRSKRPRILLPPPMASASSTSSSESKTSIISEEDEDMANCLILLANSRALDPPLFVYECKTCSKSFPSFQALGGHRASHKKPKIGPSLDLPITLVSSAIKSRVHECSICGSEFNSGQALGGHMRRHRPVASFENQEIKIKERSFLSLDLNLPAPSDDDLREFSLGPLVDCYY